MFKVIISGWGGCGCFSLLCIFLCSAVWFCFSWRIIKAFIWSALLIRSSLLTQVVHLTPLLTPQSFHIQMSRVTTFQALSSVLGSDTKQTWLALWWPWKCLKNQTLATSTASGTVRKKASLIPVWQWKRVLIKDLPTVSDENGVHHHRPKPVFLCDSIPSFEGSSLDIRRVASKCKPKTPS